MTRRLLLGASAAGLMLALAAPPSAEAAHRHSRSCGHRYSYGYVSPGYRYGYGYAPYTAPGYYYGYSYGRPGYYGYGYDPYSYSSRYYYSPYSYRRYAPYPRYYYRSRRPRISIHLDF